MIQAIKELRKQLQYKRSKRKAAGKTELIFTWDVATMFANPYVANIITLARVAYSETTNIVGAPQKRIRFGKHLLCVS